MSSIEEELVAIRGKTLNTTREERAKFETTRRLLASLANECLVHSTILKPSKVDDGSPLWLCLSERAPDPESRHRRCTRTSTSNCSRIWVALSSADIKSADDLEMKKDAVITSHGVLDPEDLVPPVIVEVDTSSPDSTNRRRVELNPGVLFGLMYPWFGDDHEPDGIRDQIIEELEDSAANQERWFEAAQKTPPPELHSPSIKWEIAMIRGHPTHPMHRTCLAQPPLEPVEPGELISSILNPEISFVSVPCADVRLSGPFQQTLYPILSKLNVVAKTSSLEMERRIIAPCLTRQLPSIHLRFPNAVKVSSDPLYVQAQSSLRTITLPPGLRFPYHLKFPLACKVTSAVRTITPWTTCVGPELSELLGKLLPDEFWVFNEVASLSGSQENFSEARHLSCLIREDLEIRANRQGEALVVASALAERDVENYSTNAERVFKLDSVDKKKAWFREYARWLFGVTIPLLVHYGICLEAHGQNILVRLHLDTGAIAGFAVRDLGGIRIHMPTLHKNGYDLKTALPGSSIITDDLHEVWSKAHHTLIQNHMNQFIRGLRLQREGGWVIAREELKSVLQADKDENARRLDEFLFAEKVPFKCFIRMQMAGVYRNYLYKDLPNILLR